MNIKKVHRGNLISFRVGRGKRFTYLVLERKRDAIHVLPLSDDDDDAPSQFQIVPSIILPLAKMRDCRIEDEERLLFEIHTNDSRILQFLG